MINNVYNRSVYLNKKQTGVFSLQKGATILTALAICDSLISLYVSVVPSIFRYGILLIWFIISLVLFEKNGKFEKYLKNLIPVVLYITFLIIKFIIGADTSDPYWTPTRLLLDAISLAFCITMVYVVSCLNSRYKCLLLKMFLALATVTVIPSLIYVRSYPDAVRDAFDGFANVNFSYIYATVSTITMAFYMLKSRGVKHRILLLIFLVMNMLLTLLANFATAFLCTLIGLVFMLICSKKRTFKSFLIILLVCIVLLLLSRGLIAELCYSIAGFDSFSAIMSYRIRAVGDFLLGKGGGSSFENRFALMNISWESFLQNPLFGISFLEFNSNTIGMHETWITMLGSAGLIGTSLYIIAIVLTLKQIFGTLKVKRFAVAYKVMLTLYLFLSFLNPMTSRDMIVAVFVIAPIFETLFKQQKTNERVLRKL